MIRSNIDNRHILKRTANCELRTAWFRLIVLALAFAGNLVAASAALAQESSVASDPMRMKATREDLESMAAQAESEATSARKGDTRNQRRAEAQAMRQRLRDGDFQVGDRILVTVDTGAVGVSDTVTVRGGRVVQLPGMPEISLQGVLRSELQEYLTQQYARIIKEPKIRSTVLLRLAIYGPVANPGFFSVPVDLMFSDLIMHAGGPGQSADLNKTVVKRGSKEVVSSKTIRRALVTGMTIDALNLRAGDAIYVGTGGTKDWTKSLRVVTLSIALGLTVYGFGKRF